MSEQEPLQSRPPEDTAGALPPVEPPSPGFLIQLFVIPLAIVTIIVLVWLLFSWLAHMGTDPGKLVRNLKKNNDASWQNALTLANLLRNPQHKQLKQDAKIAGELAAVLEFQLDTAKTDADAIKLRVFLCRALGEFRVSKVLPALLRAASQEREPAEIDVRRAALEGLAVYAENNGVQQIREHKHLMDAIVAASREHSSDPNLGSARNELRSTAAYVLGVVGGDRSRHRLEFLLGDAYPNTRYNAAVALCRHGDDRSLPVLLEMLDPDNGESVANEEDASGKQWKRLLVLRNGIRAARKLAEQNTDTDVDAIQQALETILQAEFSQLPSSARRSLRMEAQDALLEITSPE